MSDSPSAAGNGPKFRLKTFGTLALAGPDSDTILGKHGHHHRRLALLAVLAAASETGKSRDQLLLLFWPEATQARARHSLDQLLYAIRGSLDEEIFDGANPVRLNHNVITSDVGEFSDALKRHDREEAASLYAGPFLDGFNLTDAPEFEQWMESERTRLSHSYLDALENLAESSRKRGDLPAVVRWRRKICDVDPLSSRGAAALMNALSAAGDDTAALHHAARYQELVKKELGTSPSPEIALLAAAIRNRHQTQVTDSTAHASGLSTEPAELHSENTVAVTHPLPSAPPPGSSRPKPLRAVWYGVAAVVAIAAVIGTATLMRRNQGSATPSARSIAVLPLKNLSSSPQDAAFSDGLTEELIAVLARIPELRVISRTSSFVFRNSALGGRAIGDSLHVSNLLEGSVQKNGSQMRVQLRLIDTRDGSTQWSETYERELQDMFAVQSEIAADVAHELNLRMRDTALARIKRGATSNIAAYELYLRGNDPARTRSDDAVREGIKLFEQAIALDSNYAAAYAGLSRLHLRLATSDGSASSDHVAIAQQLVRKALALDPNLAEAHASNSFLLRRDFNGAGAVAEMERAIALDPTNSRIHEWLAQLYIIVNRIDAAIREATIAVQLDPLSPTANAELAHALLADNRCDEALARLAPLQELKPPLLRVTTYSARCFLRKGMFKEAVAAVNRTAVNSGATGMPFRAYVLARAGQRSEAESLRAELMRSTRHKTSTTDLALIAAGLGDKEEAFRLMENPIVGDPWVTFTLESLLEALEGDPRTAGIRRRFGI